MSCCCARRVCFWLCSTTLVHVLRDCRLTILTTRTTSRSSVACAPSTAPRTSSRSCCIPAHTAPTHTGQVLDTYLNETMGTKLELLDIWGVDREGEVRASDACLVMGLRSCSLHASPSTMTSPTASCCGTEPTWPWWLPFSRAVCLVCSGSPCVLSSPGLRIMPHSGGRVGRGIYLASENAKSSCYGTLASRLSICVDV